MNKVALEFKNCYGIKEIQHVFDFTKFKTFGIYAPNGVMKTSFAKTLDDHVNNRESKDKVFNREPYIRTIYDESGTEIDRDKVFVIKSFIDTEYTSDDISTLLVRSELREKYEQALKVLEDSKKDVVSPLRTSTQSSDCEKKLLRLLVI